MDVPSAMLFAKELSRLLMGEKMWCVYNEKYSVSSLDGSARLCVMVRCTVDVTRFSFYALIASV